MGQLDLHTLVLHKKKPLQWEARAPQLESSPSSVQEKAFAQQWSAHALRQRPSASKKIKMYLPFCLKKDIVSEPHSEQTPLSMSFHFSFYSGIAPFERFFLPNFNHLFLVGTFSDQVTSKQLTNGKSADTNQSEGILAAVVMQGPRSPRLGQQ